MRFVAATGAQVSAHTVRMGSAEWGLLLLHSLLWGSAYFFIEVALRELPLATIVAFRFVPACAALLAVALVLRLRLPTSPAAWRGFVVLSLLNSLLPFALTVYGQKTTTGGLAAVLNATTPLFSLLLAPLITSDERLSAGRLAGVAVGIAGVAILVGPDAFAGAGTTLLAKVALIGAALSYALAGHFARTLAAYHPIVIAVCQLIVGLAVAMPLALAIDQPWRLPTPSWSSVGAILGLGFLSSAAASICFFTLVKRAGASNALLVALLLPLTPIVLGAVVLGNVLTPRDTLGACVIALALIIIDGRALARLRRRTPRVEPPPQ